MTRGRIRAVAARLAAVLVAPALAGCSLSGHAGSGGRSAAAATTSGSAVTGLSRQPGPAAGGRAAALAAKVAAADRTHEVPTPAPAERVAGGWRTPADAIAVFASEYINWTSQDVSVRLRSLARVSVGQARAAATQAAAEAGADYELRQGGVANVGSVRAIAPVQGGHDEYAVVTREQTVTNGTGAYQGLPPAWHLALATVTRVRGGLWVLSGWTPES